MPRYLILAALLVCVADLCGQQPPASVVVVPVKKKDDLSVGQLFVGTVMPRRKATVGSAVRLADPVSKKRPGRALNLVDHRPI